jgi:LmbE family N-acetylglucosaminyl deacetylase
MTSGDGFPKGLERLEGINNGSAHLTSNDFQSYGQLREEEARAALESLGVRPSALTFLGFPDEGLCELASTYLSAKAQAFRSPYTGRISPPLTEQIVRGVGYVGADVQRELERVIVSFAPTVIVAPHPQDQHPDHCSTHIFLRETLDELAKAGRPVPRVLHYLIHYGQWPLADATEGTSTLAPPGTFPAEEGRWVNFALSADEVGAKRAALLLYRSQMLVLSRLLAAFARSNELFLEGEPASPPKCWCDGQNINVKTLPARDGSHAAAR